MLTKDPLDVAIVGGGASGLYCLWRLKTADKPVCGRSPNDLKVQLFDQQDGVGGRVRTVKIPGVPFLAELGAMRFRPNQVIMRGLVERLRLPVDDFNFPSRLAFLRGEWMRPDFMRARREDGSRAHNYHLAEDEYDLEADGLITLSIHKMLAGIKWVDSDRIESDPARRSFLRSIDPVVLRKKLQACGKDRTTVDVITKSEWAFIERFGLSTYDDQIWRIGFWDMIQSTLSAEATTLARHSLGYDSVIGNWNAANAIPWFLGDFAGGKYHRISGGMSMLFDALKDSLQRECTDVSVNIRHELVSIDYDRDKQVFVLGLQEGKPSITARRVILAIPKGALLRLNFGAGLLSMMEAGELSEYHAMLDSVSHNPLFKLLLTYEKPWWVESRYWDQGSGPVKSATGRAVTDLPIRQVYFYGPDSGYHLAKGPLSAAVADNGQADWSMLMASYSDGHHIEYWQPLAKREGVVPLFGGDIDSLTAEEQRVLDEFGVPRGMAQRAEHQLFMLLDHRPPGLEAGAVKAFTGVYMEWSRPPFYAGWHSWKAGVQPWLVQDKMLRPFEQLKLHICGEAYSNEQGWIEGALRSAERVLSLELNLEFPKSLESADALKLAGYSSIKQYLGMA